MTNWHIKRLVEYKIRESEDITQQVLNAIRKLGAPSPREIEKYLDVQARQQVQREYQSGKTILKTNKELEKKAKDKTVHMRTIMRKLKTLTEQELVVHANKTYSINDTLKSEIKLHGPDFGGCALSQTVNANSFDIVLVLVAPIHTIICVLIVVNMIDHVFKPLNIV